MSKARREAHRFECKLGILLLIWLNFVLRTTS